MYCSGFNSAFVEKRPDSVASHSSGSVSSLPQGHHTCRLLHKRLSHWDITARRAQGSQHGAVWKRGGGVGGSEVDREEEERDQRWLEQRKRGIEGRWKERK